MITAQRSVNCFSSTRAICLGRKLFTGFNGTLVGFGRDLARFACHACQLANDEVAADRRPAKACRARVAPPSTASPSRVALAIPRLTLKTALSPGL